MALASSLSPIIKPYEYGMHVMATLLLDHSKGTQVRSGRLHSLRMGRATSLAPMIKPSKYGMRALVTLLLKMTCQLTLLCLLVIVPVIFRPWTISNLIQMDGSLPTMSSFFGYHPTFVTSCPILVTHLLLVLKAPLSLIIVDFALVLNGPTVISPESSTNLKYSHPTQCNLAVHTFKLLSDVRAFSGPRLL